MHLFDGCKFLMCIYSHLMCKNRCTCTFFSGLEDFRTCTIVQDNFVSTGALKHVNVSRKAWPCYLLVVVRTVEFSDHMVIVLSKFNRCSIFFVEKE